MKRNRLIIVAVFLCLIVSATCAENASYAIVEPSIQDVVAPISMPGVKQVYRIEQGQQVYLNDTIDISGMGHGCDFAWYGAYGQYTDPEYIRHTDGSRKDLMNFYIDPVIFTNRPGMWYQYYGNVTDDDHGNLDAFYVIAAYRNYTETHPNGTIIQRSEIVSGPQPADKFGKRYILEDIKVSDYLVARGDPLITGFDKIWMFGRVYGLFGVNGNVSGNDMYELEPGSYSMYSHEPGSNTRYDVGYNRTENYFWTIQYVNGEPVVVRRDNLGMGPVSEEIFKKIVAETDDIITKYKLEVQETKLMVSQVDEVGVGGNTAYEFRSGITLLDVRGYTNAEHGTRINFVLDPNQQNARSISANTFNTTAITTGPGNMRVYQVYIPINKDQMPNGVHTLKGTIGEDCEIYKDFIISELPADSYRPNATLKYIDSRNPWAPNLTVQPPVIVEKVVTQIVTVTVTPSDEVVYAQQLKAQEEIGARNWENLKGLVALVFAGLAVVAGGLYAATVIFRGMKE